MALTELIDLYPTLCDLSGLDKPSHLQGKTLVPVMKDINRSHRDFAYSSYPHSKRGTRVTGHSIRTDRFRYTEWWERGTDKVVDAIFTDLETDPGEVTIVQGKEVLRRQLSSRLRDRVLAVRQP